MKLILIRHGKTSYNLKKRYCGFTDIGINRAGRVESEKLRAKLKGIRIDRIITSDLRRSLQTAKILFRDRGLRIIKNRNLREINFGEWEGLNFRQLIKAYPAYRNWLKNPFLTHIPGGEKMEGFVKRVRKEINNIIRNNQGRSVAIVSHFGPMRVILNNLLGLKRRDFWRLKLQNQRVYIIEYSR